MTSLYILLIIAVFIMAGIRYLLWNIDYYYNGEEGYEPEIEEEHTENKNPRTGGNR